MSTLTRHPIECTDNRLQMRDDPRRYRRLARNCYSSVIRLAKSLQKSGRPHEWPNLYPKNRIHAVSRREMRAASASARVAGGAA